jgi:hypothetical protein
MSQTSTVTRRGLLSGAALALPTLLTAKKSGVNSIIVGSGAHTYEVTHDWGPLPDNRQYGYTHGVVVDSQNRVFIHNQSPDAIAIFDHQGKFIKSWGKEFEAGAHGLSIGREGKNEYLIICDIKRSMVVKTSLDGEQIWQQGLPAESGVYKDKMKYVPTNVAIAPNGDVYVGDGYGSSFVHHYTKDGKYIRTWGGGKGKEAGQLNSPHGLWCDTRNKKSPQIVVADRSNERLQYFTLDGKHVSFVTQELRRPCHFDQYRDELYIPDLNARVTIFDKNNKLITHLGDQIDVWKEKGWPNLGRNRYPAGKFNSPHSLTVDKKGNIFVVEWIKDGRVTFLRRV